LGGAASGSVSTVCSNLHQGKKWNKNLATGMIVGTVSGAGGSLLGSASSSISKNVV